MFFSIGFLIFLQFCHQNFVYSTGLDAKLITSHQTDHKCPLVALERLGHSITYLQESSELIYPKSNRIADGFVNESDFCLYQSILNDIEGSIISLFVQNSTLRGVLIDGRDTQFDIPTQQLDLNNPIIRMEPFNQDQQKPADNVKFQAKNQPGLFNKPRLLELYAISDKAMVEHDRENLLPNMMITLATSDQMTRAIGLRIRLVRWEIWHQVNNFEISGDISKSLGDLSNYRFYLNPLGTIKHDSMHLFTGEVQDSRGKAYIHGMCRHFLGVSVTSTAHRDNLISRAVAFTHEVSHLLGSIHDKPSWRENAEEYTETCTCPDLDCIMIPALSDPGPVRFSNCTMQTLLRNIHNYDGDFNCLLDEPLNSLASESAICGNSQIEDGEHCDFGLLNSNETCDPKNCQLAQEKNNQRNATELCPWVYKPDKAEDDCCEMTERLQFVQRADGSTCNGDQGFCHGGFCQSRDSQCKRAFGSNFRSAPVDMYVINGGRTWSSGFCNYQAKPMDFERFDFDTATCSVKNKECGALLCTDGTVEVQIDVSSFDTVIRHHMSVHGHTENYVSAIKDYTLSGVPDPLLVAPGIQCNGGSGVCKDKKCVGPN